jgi:hypothetical protein
MMNFIYQISMVLIRKGPLLPQEMPRDMSTMPVWVNGSVFSLGRFGI